ncbi:hypothetical protein [Puia sp.]|jgi:hypothetical protein|uniref:hypothetical protein n=1 Tax=Puia sp. TaxID=2045100 RepID=UPI002F4103F1
MRIITTTLLLFICGAAWAQAEKDSLQSAFVRYQSHTPREKLFVHMDKTVYLAGETIWFKLYSLDAVADTPLTLSNGVYVEVLDKDQKAVLQEKLALDNARGDGYFRIPASIPSGHYVFRAYTNWMKNFSPDGYYQQQLTILNTLSESAGPDSSRHGEDNIRFFPEGGNLVNGISSVIAFKAVNAAGRGITCHGVIVTQQQDTVARFQSNQLGMGNFSLTPAKGNSYYARVETPSSVQTEKLPTAFDQGYVMHLDRPEGKDLRILVTATSATTAPVVYLFVHTRGQAKMVRTGYLNNNQVSFSVNPDSLDEGISHFTVLNSNRQPVCERLWCKPPRRQLHIGVNMTAAANPREKIMVRLSTTRPDNRPARANLSVSVFLLDSLQSIPEENIVNYLLLTSDLRGRIESPASYFENTDPATSAILDNLMLTQGWTRFRWEDILRDKLSNLDFRPEKDGLQISGRIIDRRTNLPPPPTIGYLSVPGRRFSLATTLSRSDGSLLFHVNPFYGSREIIVQADNRADSNLHIEISNPFSDRFAWQPETDSLIPAGARNQLLYRSINVQAENAYRTAEKHRLSPLSPGDTTGFYGYPDLRYNLDDYTRFVTMDEVVREYIQDVRVRRNSGSAYFRVRNALFNNFFDDDPLLLVDGVPVFDGAKMMSIDPLRIDKIDVVSHRYQYGPSFTDGIVSFLSYQGDLGGYTLDPSAVAVQYNGFQQHQEFYSPIYQPGDQSPLPDLRNQLLWSPEVDTDAAGEKQLSLYTSDWKGKYVLVVQGITADGLPGYAVSTFTVGK